MPWSERHPPSARNAVRALMCESDLSVEAIAEQTKIPYATVCKWNQLHGWRPSAVRGIRTLRPDRFPIERILAIGRVLAVAGVDPGDLAAAIGARRERAEAFFRSCGYPGRAGPEGPARTGDDLRTTLRVHVARQIAAFDAELAARSRRPRAGARLTRAAEPPPVDSAKLLRDLAGLKRLLDDLDAAEIQAAEAAALSKRRVEIAAEREWHRQCNAFLEARNALLIRRR